MVQKWGVNQHPIFNSVQENKNKKQEAGTVEEEDIEDMQPVKLKVCFIVRFHYKV